MKRDGLAVVSVELDDGYIRYGYIDKTGNHVIEPTFDRCYPFAKLKCHKMFFEQSNMAIFLPNNNAKLQRFVSLGI